jgi:hypothetical protein
VKDKEGPTKDFFVALKYTGHDLNGEFVAHFLNINDKKYVEFNGDLFQCLDLFMRDHPLSEAI